MHQYSKIAINRRFVLTGSGAFLARYSCTGNSTIEKPTPLLTALSPCLICNPLSGGSCLAAGVCHESAVTPVHWGFAHKPKK